MDAVEGLAQLVRWLWRNWRASIAGVLAGAVAFGAVYVATYAIQSREAENTARFVEALAAFLGGDAGSLLRGIANWLEPEPGQVVSWFVYASHFVPLELDGSGLGQSVHEIVDVQEFSVWNDALLFVPPVVLVLAGIALAAFYTSKSAESAPASWLTGSRLALGYGATRLDAPASWLTGSRLALGYGATALLVSTTAHYERSIGFASATVAPDALTVGLHTTAYALVFGTVGALLHTAYESKAWRRG